MVLINVHYLNLQKVEKEYIESMDNYFLNEEKKILEDFRNILKKRAQQAND
jgi:hypothetical protein